MVDQDWGEPLLDTGTEAKRRAIATIVAGWIAGCARDGYQAVEIDNLDSYTRSGGALRQAGNVALMGRFSAAAHAHGLAAAQKNAVEVLPRVAEMGTDFAVAEECNRYDECAAYQRVYGDRVYVVEYTDAAFATGCRRWPNLLSVRRDLALAGPGAQGHLHRRC